MRAARSLIVRRRGLARLAPFALAVGLVAGFGTNPPDVRASIGGETGLSIAPAAADTLRFEHVAGTPFLHALPERHRGQYVAYEAVELPALSWVQDRSIYWKSLPEQRGPHRLVLTRTTLDAVADTVVLLVDLRAE